MGASLGFTPGQVVQEFYYDEDVDGSLRAQVEKDIGAQIVTWDYSDLVDGVLIWWRADDAAEEDLADVLLDAAANMDDEGGQIWVLTPKPGRGEEVPMDEIDSAAKLAGLQATSSTSVARDWSGMLLVARPRKR